MRSKSKLLAVDLFRYPKLRGIIRPAMNLTTKSKIEHEIELKVDLGTDLRIDLYKR